MSKKTVKIDKFRKELLIIKLTICLLFPSDLISADNQNSQNLHTFNGHTYKKVELPMSWTEASKFAGEKSGTLVKIESFQENTFLKSFMSQTQTSASDGGGSEYFWWPSVSSEWFMALGSRSNNIYVHPGLDLVAVRNSTLEIVGDTNERKNSYHLTKFPAKWDHVEFFQTVVDSVIH